MRNISFQAGCISSALNSHVWLVAAGLLFRTEQFQVISQLQIWSWRRPYWGPLFFGLGRWVCRLPHSYHFETSLLCFSVGFPVFWTSGLLISLWWSRLVTVGTGDKGMLLTRLSLESFWANLAACLLGRYMVVILGPPPSQLFWKFPVPLLLCWILPPNPCPVYLTSFSFLVYFLTQVEDMLQWIAAAREQGW